MICKTDERIYKIAIWAQCFKRRDISLHPDFPIDEVLWIFYSFAFAWLTSTPEHLCSLSTQKGLSLCVPWKAFSLPTAASFIKIKEIREEKLKKMLSPYQITFLLNMNSSLAARANVYGYLCVKSVVEMMPRKLK